MGVAAENATSCQNFGHCAIVSISQIDFSVNLDGFSAGCQFRSVLVKGKLAKRILNATEANAGNPLYWIALCMQTGPQTAQEMILFETPGVHDTMNATKTQSSRRTSKKVGVGLIDVASFSSSHLPSEWKDSFGQNIFEATS